jgi:RNA polymerase sigma-70 factor (ECF subfamily)
VKRTAKGDTRAFEVLVRRYQQSLADLAYRFLGDSSEAEDIAQETFIRLYLTAEQYRPERPLKAYLLRIAKNLCLDHLRKKKPMLDEDIEAVETHPNSLDALLTSETSKKVLWAVQSLPDSQRMALLLQHFEGLSYNETADVMETTVPAVESLLVRAKKNLREKLKNFI